MVASHVPPTGDLAHNPGCALTGNRTCDPFVCRLVYNPLSHTSQGPFWDFCVLSEFCSLVKLPAFSSLFQNIQVRVSYLPGDHVPRLGELQLGPCSALPSAPVTGPCLSAEPACTGPSGLWVLLLSPDGIFFSWLAATKRVASS